MNKYMAMFEYPEDSYVRFLYDISNFDDIPHGGGGPYFSIRIGQKAQVVGKDSRHDGWIQVRFGGNIYAIDGRFVISEMQWDKLVDNVAQYTKLTYQG